MGGNRVLGATLDDAAGEALINLQNVGTGVSGWGYCRSTGKAGDREAFRFPRPLIKENHLNFSFSGLKTAALRQVESLHWMSVARRANDLCASYQEAIVMFYCISSIGRGVRRAERAVLTGGVSANSRLRERAEEWASQKGIQLAVPPIRYCTDNAAMVGYVGIQRLNRGEQDSQSLGPSPQLNPTDFEGMAP